MRALRALARPAGQQQWVGEGRLAAAALGMPAGCSPTNAPCHGSIDAVGPIVRFMLKEMAKVGCAMRREDLQCMPCDNTRSGGFSPEYGIQLCQNRFVNKDHMEETIAHEMVHAYDHW